MSCVAVIPARAGSKRIVGKNTKHFCGKPLLQYSIDAALNSGLFDRVIVSTDSEEIAELANTLGAETPFLRPHNLADDYTGTREVINHAIESLQELGYEFDYCCCIYATAPFLQQRYLLEGFNKLQSEPDKEFAFSVSSFDFPIQRAIGVSEEGVSVLYPEYIEMRSQDLEEAFHDAGQFYWGRTIAFLGENAIFSKYAIGIKIPRKFVQDIDTPEDWERAELMYKAYSSTKI